MSGTTHPRKEYRHLFTRSIAPGDRYYKSLPYQGVELERTACLGRCPVYQLTLRANGTAVWRGKAYTERIGDFHGTFMINDFGKLCYLIDLLRIEALRPHYRVMLTDQPGTIVRVTRADETELSIHDYGNAGPIELWALQQAIDSIALRVSWAAAANQDGAGRHPMPEPEAAREDD